MDDTRQIRVTRETRTISRPLFGSVKRAIDVAGAIVGLIGLAIPFLLIATVIKLESRGGVFFRQTRSGKGGKPFRIYKFRTMRISEGPADLRTSKADPRITRSGRLLREFSIDELPQLINILRGDMSLIGPRPTVPEQVARYGSYEWERLGMRPGITSLAGVRGRNALNWRERIDLDVEYLGAASLALDLKIFAKLLWVAFITREGVYNPSGLNDAFEAEPTAQDPVPGMIASSELERNRTT